MNQKPLKVTVSSSSKGTPGEVAALRVFINKYHALGGIGWERAGGRKREIESTMHHSEILSLCHEADKRKDGDRFKLNQSSTKMQTNRQNNSIYSI